jgi:hypothetical protein
MIHGSGEREIAVAEAATLAEQHCAAFEVETLDADMFALARSHSNDHGAALACRVLLDHDRVGARRQDAARENARGFAGADRAAKWMSGCNFADELELDRRLGHVNRAHRVAVHRRNVGRRLGAQRRDIGGEQAAVRLRERHSFDG